MESKGKIKKMSFPEYCRDRKLLLISSVLVTVAVYVMWAVQDIVTFDAEGSYYNATAQKWYNLSIAFGRWGTYYVKKLFGTLLINPYFLVTTFFIFFPLSVIIWNYNFYVWDKRKTISSIRAEIGELIFALIYLTHPIWAFVFSYRSHMEVMTFAICLVPVSLLFLSKGLEEDSPIFLAVSLLLTVLTFSCYSTFMLLYGMGVCVYLYYSSTEKGISNKNTLILIMKLALFTIVALAVYYLTVRITTSHWGTTVGNSYLTDNFKWGTEPVKDSLERLCTNVKKFFVGDETICSSLFLWVVLLGAIINICGIIKKKYSFWRIVFFAGITVAPFLLNVVTAGDIVVRSQFTFVCALAFLTKEVCSEIINVIDSRLEKGKARIEIKRLLLLAGAAVLSVFIIKQAQYDTRWLYSDVKTMQIDFDALETIYFDAMEEGGQEGDAIALIGGRRPQYDETMLTGEVIGFSYFTFNGNNDDYSKTIEAMNAMGYKLSVPTQEQIEKAKEMTEDMEVWPTGGSIKVVDHLIVVRLQ